MTSVWRLVCVCRQVSCRSSARADTTDAAWTSATCWRTVVTTASGFTSWRRSTTTWTTTSSTLCSWVTMTRTSRSLAASLCTSSTDPRDDHQHTCVSSPVCNYLSVVTSLLIPVVVTCHCLTLYSSVKTLMQRHLAALFCISNYLRDWRPLTHLSADTCPSSV